MPDWKRLFPDSDHRLQMNLRPGDVLRYWAQSDDAGAVLRERRTWLAQTPERYVSVLPEGAAAVDEAIAFMLAQVSLPPAPPLQAAGELEPDWVILSGDAALSHPVIGGAVIFTSNWALEDKIGRPLHDVHAPVPGLQSSLGRQINTFLSRLQPGAAWERENWGLSAAPALNHHPAIARRRLDADATLDSTWLRLEEQFLTRLPASRAILFGIRVSNHRLDHLATQPGIAARLARALETMTEDVARYKGILPARDALVKQLDLHA